MDLWRLQIFCQVVEEKSFSKAGQKAHLSQPTVSSHVRDLEAHFGCRLIDRLAKGAEPTQAGLLLYRYARKLIALKDATEAAMAEFQGQIKGRLVVGGSTIPGTYILPQIVGAFKVKYADIMIALRISDTADIINEVAEGVLDLGIVGAEIKEKRVVQEKLIQDEMRLMVWADHKWARKKEISLQMLLNEPFIVREPGSGTLKSLSLSLHEKGYAIDDLNIVAEMGSTEAVSHGVQNRIGVSIFSTIAVAAYLKAGLLKALSVEGLNLKRNFYLTTHRLKSASPLAASFIEFLKQTCRR